jgi:hypothetical protein
VLVAVIAAAALVVMLLWNWLIPPLFARPVITYWQALGLLILSRLLFGALRGRPHAPWHWRQRMLERWEQMTPEERERFRQGLQGGGCR